MNLEDILSRHLTAAGGRVAVESLRALRVDLHIVEPEFTVDGVYIAERTGRMRVDIYMEEVRVFAEQTVDLQTGETLQTVKVREMMVNPVLGVGDFEQP